LGGSQAMRRPLGRCRMKFVGGVCDAAFAHQTGCGQETLIGVGDASFKELPAVLSKTTHNEKRGRLLSQSPSLKNRFHRAM
jgi:hypothetical protein